MIPTAAPRVRGRYRRRGNDVFTIFKFMLRPNTNPTIYQEDRIILMCLEASEHCFLKFHKVMKCTMKAGLSRRKGATAWGKLNSSFPHLMTVCPSLSQSAKVLRWGTTSPPPSPIGAACTCRTCCSPMSPWPRCSGSCPGEHSSRSRDSIVKGKERD